METLQIHHRTVDAIDEHRALMCVVNRSSQMTWSDVVSDINEVKTPIYNCYEGKSELTG